VQHFLNSLNRDNVNSVTQRKRSSTLKNEHAITNNQRKPEGGSASNLSASEAQRKQNENKRDEKEKNKQRQVSHSAGADKNR